MSTSLGLSSNYTFGTNMYRYVNNNSYTSNLLMPPMNSLLDGQLPLADAFMDNPNSLSISPYGMSYNSGYSQSGYGNGYSQYGQTSYPQYQQRSSSSYGYPSYRQTSYTQQGYGNRSQNIFGIFSSLISAFRR